MWRNVKALLGPSLLLLLSLALALASSAARGERQFYASAFLALLSLLLAAFSSILLVPKLVAQVRRELAENFRFVRFTRRGGIFLVIILVVAFSALNTGNNLLILILSFLMGSFIVSGVVSNLVLHRLKVSLHLPTAVHACQRAVCLVRLENLKRYFPSFAVRLSGQKSTAAQEKLTDFFLQEKRYPYLKAGQALKSRVDCQFSRRGIYSIDGFEVHTSFPFGFLSRGRSLNAAGTVLVYPQLLEVPPMLNRYPQLLGSRERRRRGQGSGLYKVRPYQSGDGTRFIHWKSSAKLSQLMVKDFMAEEETPLNLLFSTWLPARDAKHLDQFEKAISWIASLSRFYKKRGCGFQFDSGEYRVHVNGRSGSYRELMEYLSCVTPAKERGLHLENAPDEAIVFWAGPVTAPPAMAVVNYLTL